MLVYHIAEMVFHGVQRIPRQEFPIGQRCQPVPIAGNTYKTFHVAIPRGDIGVPDGPVNRKAVAGRALEIIFAPPLCLSRPQ